MKLSDYSPATQFCFVLGLLFGSNFAIQANLAFYSIGFVHAVPITVSIAAVLGVFLARLAGRLFGLMTFVAAASVPWLILFTLQFALNGGVKEYMKCLFIPYFFAK